MLKVLWIFICFIRFGDVLIDETLFFIDKFVMRGWPTTFIQTDAFEFPSLRNEIDIAGDGIVNFFLFTLSLYLNKYGLSFTEKILRIKFIALHAVPQIVIIQFDFILKWIVANSWFYV